MIDDKAWQKCQAGHDKHDLLVVDTQIGEMTIYDYEKYMGFDGYCSGQDDISRTLGLYGRWEVEETECVRKVLEAGDTNNIVVDVGAHIGWFSRLAEEYGYSCIGYEADAENIELYKLNTSNSSIVRVWFDENLQITDKPTKTIELLKIDIEGAEKYAVEIFKDCDINNIFMEISPCFNDGYPALVKSIANRGYDVFNLDMTPFNFRYNFDQSNLLFRRKSLKRI